MHDFTKKAGNNPATRFRYAVPVIAAMLAAAFLVPVQADAASCGTLSASKAWASGYQSTSPPERAIDGNLKTGWANGGVGSWITVDLGSPKTVCSVDVAWYRGDVRSSSFVIWTSLDGTTFSDVFTGKSSGSTLAPERYSFEPTGARYVKISVYGNTENNWAAIMEIRPNGYPAGIIVHTVSAGEYLSMIGKQYGVPWQDIAERNNIISPYIIYPGQKLEVNALAGKTCSDGWWITAYFTPIESDYTSTGTVTVSTDKGTRTFYKGFVEEIKIQGSGKTLAGDYLGYWSDSFHIMGQPLTSSGVPVQVGQIATDTSLIPYGKKVAIPFLPGPWDERVFTATDTGPAIVGKHIDVYTGFGLEARKEAFRITGTGHTVCY